MPNDAPNDAPNDTKARMDRDVHHLQDQPAKAGDAHEAKTHPSRDERNAKPEQRQPLQAQQRNVTGTTLPDPDKTSNSETDDRLSDHDYGRKTGAAADHPYSDDTSTPPDTHTEINREADLADPSGR